MKTTTKFILNRNDKVFYFVEKTATNFDTHYTLYHDIENKEVYNQQNFHTIYGSDIKMSLRKFAFDATKVLIHGINDDYEQEKSYNYFIEMSSKLRTLSRLNPRIDNKQFIKAIEVFNRALPDSFENIIDYTNDYMLVNGLTIKELTKEHVKTIEQSYNNQCVSEENNSTFNEKGLGRVKKYEN